MENIYNIFNEFMNTFDLYPHEVPGYPGYTCDRMGNVYRPDGTKIRPFKSSGYEQVYMKDEHNNRSVKGVHQVVSMTFDPEYYPGCVVHHIDENKKHNEAYNLKVESNSDHARHHANPENLIKHIREHGPHNKGKKMTQEFCEHCREAALKRKNKFRGNQFVDALGNPKSNK